MSFREVWARVSEQAGSAFDLPSGETFSYTFNKTFVVIEPGRVSIPKTNFEKTYLRGEQAMLQGRKHILAILGDSRVKE